VTDLERAAHLVRANRRTYTVIELHAILRAAFPSIGLVPIFVAASRLS